MTTHDARTETNGFVRFFRNYTKTWVHAVATAGLTAFGTLTIVHRWFAALAIASYLVPPLLLYLRRGQARPLDGSASTADSSGEDRSSISDEPESESADRSGQSSEPEAAAPRAGVEATATTDAAAETEPDAATATAAGDRSDTEPDVTADQHPDTGSETGESRGSALERAESPDCDDTEAAGSGVRGDVPVDGRALDEDEPDEAATRGESTADDEAAGESAERRPEWRAVDAPTEATLRDATVSSTSGGYAVGDGGTVLAGGGGDGADEWTVLLEDGPAAGDNDLRGVDATTDGDAIWVAGDSGSLGRIDATTGRHVDYTAPEGITDNWLGVAVAGESGEETILLINGSGSVLRGAYRDETLEWTGPDKPGSGSSLSGVALLEDGVGYCCDTSDGVFETTDGGQSFERVGLEGADGTLTDVATAGESECLVTADDGVVHRYDGPTWTPERVADQTLSGIASSDERVAVCTDDAVSERAGPTGEWERFDVDVSGPLLGISIDADRGVAVGESGTLVERT